MHTVDTHGANGDPRPHEDVIDRYSRYETILGPGPPQAFTNLISGVTVAPVEQPPEVGVVECGVEVADEYPYRAVRVWRRKRGKSFR